MDNKGSEKRILVKFGELSGKLGMARREEQWTPGDAAQVARFAADPQAQAMMARHKLVLDRGPLALVLVDDSNGLLAIIRIGDRTALTRYFVASKVGFDDDVLHRAQGLAEVYELQHPDDLGPVTLKLYGDSLQAAQ